MGYLINLEIGGMRTALSSNCATILKEPEPAYQPFLELEKVDKHFDHRAVDIRFCLQLGELPNTKKLEKLFDGGKSWSIFRDGNDYCLTHNHPSMKQPLRLVRMNRDFTEGTIYVGKKLAGTGNGRTVLSNPLSYPMDQILLMYILAQKEGALLHAAGLKLNGKGVIFPGKSGAGKSTLTRQFAARGNATLLSDDRIVVRKIGEIFKAYGTPWPGDAGIAVNKNVPLSGIFFLNHGSANRITAMKPQQALERLLPVTSIPWYDRDFMPKILDFCEDLVLNVPAYELDFKPNAEVVDVLEKYIST